MTRDERFFYVHAGFSYDTTKETAAQGKTRNAIQLARAEKYARDHDWFFTWEYDQEGCSGCECGSEDCACYTGAPHDVMRCILRDSEPISDAYGRSVDAGKVLASLCGICGADSNYSRLIEAELAWEALSDIECALRKNYARAWSQNPTRRKPTERVDTL